MAKPTDSCDTEKRKAVTGLTVGVGLPTRSVRLVRNCSRGNGLRYFIQPLRLENAVLHTTCATEKEARAKNLFSLAALRDK